MVGQRHRGKALSAVVLACFALPSFAEDAERGQTCEQSNGDRVTIVMRLSKGPIVFYGTDNELVMADCKSRSALEVSTVEETNEPWQTGVMDEMLKADVSKTSVSFADFERQMRAEGYNTRTLKLSQDHCACDDGVQDNVVEQD